jgi:hypothetical protein
MPGPEKHDNGKCSNSFPIDSLSFVSPLDYYESRFYQLLSITVQNQRRKDHSDPKGKMEVHVLTATGARQTAVVTCAFALLAPFSTVSI